MKARVAAGAGVIAALAASSLNTRPARAQPRNPLVGTWTLVSTIITASDGAMRPDPQVGTTPKGYMIYSDANRMCAQFTNPARPLWKSTTEPTYDELKSMV